jgi:ribokinase
VNSFPVEYSPVRYPFFGVESSVSGVGYNLAKALTRLGDTVRFLSLIGQDQAGKLVWNVLEEDGIPQGFIKDSLSHTPQSVILYDVDGRRQIHVDLKDIQEKAYPDELFEQAQQDCSLAVLCNINFSRAFLQKARRAGMLVATDVHAISSLDDEYNSDFMQAADILFMSDEGLAEPPEQWLQSVWNRYGAEVVVIGLGAKGALLGLRSEGYFERIPAVATRPVVNTIGAGDALFSCFIHFYQSSGDAHTAIRKAVVFASYKIGAKGAADGFLNESGLENLYKQIFSNGS